MKTKIYLSIALAFLLVLPMLSALESIGTFKQNDCITLPQTCDNCSYINITSILYPNSTQALGQVAMTKTGTYYNYTFCDTSTLGTYVVSGEGDPYYFTDVWSYSFEITPTGEHLSISNSFLFIGILAFLIILFIMALYRIFNSNGIPSIFFSIAASYLLLIGVIFVAGEIVNNFIPNFPAIGQFLDTALILLIIGLFPLIIFMVIYLLYKMFNEKEISKMQDMGYTEAEARKFNRRH